MSPWQHDPEGMTRLYAQCQCGETHPSALRSALRGDGSQCANCVARAAGRCETACACCGTIAPFDRHHVRGRKVSDEIVLICKNCHAKIHSRFKDDLSNA